MGSQWIATKIDMDSVDWKGNLIHLKDVPAIQNVKTRKIRVYPEEVSKAEIRMLAEEHGIVPRDVPLLLVLYAQAGPFEAGIIHTKYRVNKALFYQWKDLEKVGLGNAFPHDEFERKPKGPIPKHLWDDFRELEKLGIVTISMKPWGPNQMQKSAIVELSGKGQVLAKVLWDKVADPFKETTLKVKEWIITSDPETIRKRVHREFPEYKETYAELDTE